MKQALSVKVGGKHISEVLALSVDDEIDFFKDLNLSETDEQIAAPILKEVSSRLKFLRNVGLQYLTLSRAAGTLSGGGSATNSFSDTNRVKLIWRALYFRRAIDWTSPTRQ